MVEVVKIIVQFSSVAQSCLTLCDPMDCRLPGSSIYGIFQVRVLEWGAIAFSTTIVWPQVNSKEGTQLHTSTENWVKDLLSMDPPIRTRSSFLLRQSHQEASISLLSFSIRGQTDRKPQSQKTNQSDQRDHSLV